MFNQYFEKPRVLRGIESANFTTYLDSFAQELDGVGFARKISGTSFERHRRLCTPRITSSRFREKAAFPVVGNIRFKKICVHRRASDHQRAERSPGGGIVKLRQAHERQNEL